MSEDERREELRRVREAAGGDRDAFEILYRDHRDFVLRVAARFGAEGSDGHDVLQETFLYLIRKLPTLELSARLATFLYPVAKHLALKRKSDRGHLCLEEVPEKGEPFADREVESRLRAEGLLNRLPPAQREVVELRFLEEFRLEEIAEALDLPLGTVKSRLHNALHVLREVEGEEK